MGRWLAAFVCGILLTAGNSLVAQEDDPFAEDVPPPVSAIQLAPVLVPAPVPAPPQSEPPVIPLPAIRRPLPNVEPTAAQQRVIERAAQEARQRKIRIEQRKHAGPPPVPTFFPSEGRLAGPSLFHIDPGIRIAFRPIALSGFEPLPTLTPTRLRSKPASSMPAAKAPSKRVPHE